jgi:hypothetical protein
MDQHDSFFSSSDVPRGGNGAAPTDDEFLTPAIVAAGPEGPQTFKFDLISTSLRLGRPVDRPIKAQVRYLDLADRAEIGALPTAMQSRVLRALAAIGKGTPAIDEKTDTLSIPQAFKNLEKNEELVNAYCVVGFVRPPLIWTEAERTGPDQVVVTAVALKDRRAYAAICMSDDEAAAERLSPFPVGPLPTVEAGRSAPIERDTPVPIAEPAPSL